MLALIQGTNLPASWLAQCQSWTLDTPRFSGELCLPWDSSYQQNLGQTLQAVGTALRGHPALAGVYLTTTTMTNGVELHWRVNRADFPYPGDEVFRGAYLDIMDLYQEAFDKPIVFEAGHCPWSDQPDCELPALLYRHARDRYGVQNAGVAVWNCAERFWAGPDGDADTYGVRALLEEVSQDGASFGCQTVGSFTNGACRFSDPEVGDYGLRQGVMGDTCPEDPDFNPEQACRDTLGWFAGQGGQAQDTAQVMGTWLEGWTRDFQPTGVYQTDAACQEGVDRFAAP